MVVPVQVWVLALLTVSFVRFTPQGVAAAMTVVRWRSAARPGTTGAAGTMGGAGVAGTAGNAGATGDAGARTEPGVMRKVPGVRKTADVTLKRGVIESAVIWNWIEAVVKREPNRRRDVELAVVGDGGRQLASFVLSNAWPVKFESADFKAEGNDVAIETLELTSEGLAPA